MIDAVDAGRRADGPSSAQPGARPAGSAPCGIVVVFARLADGAGRRRWRLAVRGGTHVGYAGRFAVDDGGDDVRAVARPGAVRSRDGRAGRLLSHRRRGRARTFERRLPGPGPATHLARLSGRTGRRPPAGRRRWCAGRPLRGIGGRSSLALPSSITASERQSPTFAPDRRATTTKSTGALPARLCMHLREDRLRRRLTRAQYAHAVHGVLGSAAPRSRRRRGRPPTGRASAVCRRRPLGSHRRPRSASSPAVSPRAGG